jgi:hypothetical protein
LTDSEANAINVGVHYMCMKVQSVVRMHTRVLTCSWESLVLLVFTAIALSNNLAYSICSTASERLIVRRLLLVFVHILDMITEPSED